MTGEDLLTALELPASCRVNRRVPKKLLLENGAPTATDKKLITAGIEDIHWLAALKPNTIGVPAYQDHERSYPEIAVLSLLLRPESRTVRLIELLHRAIPYPTVLLTLHGQHNVLSVADIRWAQNEADKTVLDGEVIAVSNEDPYDRACWREFIAALGVTRLPRTSLLALYHGWMDCMIGLKSSRITGRFNRAGDPTIGVKRREALAEYERLNAEIAELRRNAEKEKQMTRRVELNVHKQRLEAELAKARLLLDGTR